MKKTFNRLMAGAFAVFMMMGVTACSDNSGKSKVQNTNNVQNTIDQQVAKESSSEETTAATTEATTAATTEATTLAGAQATNTDASGWSYDVSPEEIAKYSSEDADIDLTKMDSNMIYSTVYQLTSDAHTYTGKIVKMKGQYYAGVDEETGVIYHFVLLKDALACCQQGMEFEWGDGSHKYPDEYPSDGTEVVVVGRFETYKDDPNDVYEYCHVADASLEVVGEE